MTSGFLLRREWWEWEDDCWLPDIGRRQNEKARRILPRRVLPWSRKLRVRRMRTISERGMTLSWCGDCRKSSLRRDVGVAIASESDSYLPFIRLSVCQKAAVASFGSASAGQVPDKLRILHGNYGTQHLHEQSFVVINHLIPPIDSPRDSLRLLCQFFDSRGSGNQLFQLSRQVALL